MNQEGPSGDHDPEAELQKQIKREEIKGTGPEISMVCGSQALDNFLSENPLNKMTFEFPKSLALDFVKIPEELDDLESKKWVSCWQWTDDRHD